MLNQHKTLFWIFIFLLVFAIFPDAYAQTRQNSDTGLSESQYTKLLEEIRKLDTKIAQTETNLRTHIDEKTSELSKEINQVRTDVAYIKGQMSLVKWVVAIIGAPILVGTIINYFQNRKNKTEADTENRKKSGFAGVTVLQDKEIDPEIVFSSKK